MKVTFCTYDTPTFVGGSNSWLCRLLPELVRRGIEVRVLFFINASSPDECSTYCTLRDQGIKCSTYPCRYTYTEDRALWILNQLVKEPPDVFVPNMLVSAFYAARWVKEAEIPTVGLLHADDPFHYAVLSEFVFGQPAYQLSAVACVSQFLEQEVIKQAHNSTTLIRRLPCGAPVPLHVAQPPTTQLKLAYVGRLIEEQKRISDVTQALCRVVQEVPDTQVVIYGDGDARHSVAQIIEENNCEPLVRLGGRVDSAHIQQAMLECHVLVLLSDYEGLPVAVMEAMACGVVPICLRVRSGILELVEDGVTGLLVSDRGDDFVAAVRRLRYEPQLWEKLSASARAKIEAEYSNEVCAANWEAFLRELHQGARQRRTIKIPNRFNLPPVHPDFEQGDYRPLHASPILLLRRLQLLAGIKVS